MAKKCPNGRAALYTECIECEGMECEAKRHKYKHVSIGVDQSYKRTGISISADGRLLKVKSIDLKKMESKTLKREAIRSELRKALAAACSASSSVSCTIERIRLHSQGFLSMDYIKSIGALNSVVVDECFKWDVEVFTVDTRCWKSTVVGTSKPSPNSFGVAPEKWPTVRWAISQGFEKSIARKVEGRREKGTFTTEDGKFEYDDDASDSAAISMFWFVGDHSKLKREK